MNFHFMYPTFSFRKRLRSWVRIVPPTLGTVLFIVAGCGCQNTRQGGDRQSILAGHIAAGAPTNFINQVTQADRLVVSNLYPQMLPDKYRNFCLKISGQQLREVVAAVTKLEPYGAWITKGVNGGEHNIVGYSLPGVVFCWELRFYRGKNLLAKAQFDDELVFCGDYFHDDTGVVKKLYDKAKGKTTLRWEEKPEP